MDCPCITWNMYVERFNSYHGTCPKIAKELHVGKVSVHLGGGELGQGFYTGEHIYEAKAWAFHKTGTRRENVVKFTNIIVDMKKMNILVLSVNSAKGYRMNIKTKKETRSFVFNKDITISKIVGSSKANGCQLKWESFEAEKYLNSTNTIREII